MTPERWQKLYQLFDAAIELPEDRRSAFLDTACADDNGLRTELESLIAAASKGANPIGTAVGRAAADYVAAPQMGSGGQFIGVYQIARPLGKGGMGEVFLALDPRLNREVALKLLTRQYTADAWRVRRFQQEARLASALNHPNILVVHELGEFEGRQFIATEYVEGRTLRAEIADGRMAPARALDIATQTAAALTAAHRAGIVHRDVKPENIMVRPDGYVKVLDFGLAKLTERSSTGGAGTETATLATLPGMVVGTVDYMSPEQARGETVDPRSDIFSLGVVLYEILAGAPPFHGDTAADSIALILRGPLPPLETRAPGTPPELARIVSKALARKLENRYQSMAEFHGDLKARKQELDAHALIAQTTIARVELPRRRSVVTWGAAAAGVAGAALIGARFLRHQPPISSDAIRITRIPTSNEVIWGLISPDGKYILTVRDSEGMTSLWARPRLDSAGEIQVAPPAPVSYWGLAYSPDGNYLYCTVASRVAGGGGVLYRQPALGGTRERIAGGVDAVGVADPAGRRVLFRRNHTQGESPGLFIVDESGEHTVSISDTPYAFYAYYWTPGGKAIQYVSGSRFYSHDWSLNERIPGSARETTVLRGQQGPLAYPVMVEPSGLLAVSSDPDSGLRQICYISIPEGRRYRITHDAGEYISQSVTADGKIILANQQTIENDVWIAGLGNSPAQHRRITSGAGGYSSLAWLPGGRLVATISTANAANLYTMDADGSNLHQLTATGDVHGYTPAVSRDGRFLLFSAGSHGAADLRVLELETGRVRPVVTGQHVGDATFSADGRTIFFVAAHVSDWALWKIPFEGGTPVRLLDCEEATPVISPDGSTLATLYSRTATAERYLVLLNVASGEITRMPLPRSIGDLSWAGGDALFYGVQAGPDSGVWRLPLSGGTHQHVFHPDQPKMWGYSVEAGGKRVAYVAGRALSNLVQITNFR